MYARNDAEGEIRKYSNSQKSYLLLFYWGGDEYWILERTDSNKIKFWPWNLSNINIGNMIFILRLILQYEY